jgi:para-nitrobenzyl esterase
MKISLSRFALIPLLVIVLAFTACSGADSSLGDGNSGDTVELTTPSGPIKGIQNGDINVYKGIPYANPPERFAPPEPVTPWEETLDCTEFGPAAIQTTTPQGMEMSEDCLSLNIWTPSEAVEINNIDATFDSEEWNNTDGTSNLASNNDDATTSNSMNNYDESITPTNKNNGKLPVYVWIHGGGFGVGTGANPKFDGTKFAEDGVILITINYRLNAHGFFANQETYDQYGTTGNWGILDQIEALKWIKQNVSAFGGDPNKVTVGGESAGSHSTSALIQSPLAKGLFARAILESGTILGIPANRQYNRGNLERSIELGHVLAYTFGAGEDAAGLKKLREADAGVLAQLTEFNTDFTETPAFMMVPVFDGHVMAKNPYKALKSGDYNDVDLLWGFNGNEGSMFIPEGQTNSRYEMLVSKMFGYDNARTVLDRFPIDGRNDATKRSRQILGYGMFSAVMKPYGDALSSNGGNVYAYYFNYAGKDNIKKGLGARHASEINYAFGTLPKNATEEEHVLSDEIHTRWVNFIKTGNPNGGELSGEIQWPKYNAKDNQMLTFDTELSVGKMPNLNDMIFMEDIMFGKDGTYFD